MPCGSGAAQVHAPLGQHAQTPVRSSSSSASFEPRAPRTSPAAWSKTAPAALPTLLLVGILVLEFGSLEILHIEQYATDANITSAFNAITSILRDVSQATTKYGWNAIGSNRVCDRAGRRRTSILPMTEPISEPTLAEWRYLCNHREDSRDAIVVARDQQHGAAVQLAQGNVLQFDVKPFDKSFLGRGRDPSRRLHEQLSTHVVAG
jgi:hypothetical protein